MKKLLFFVPFFLLTAHLTAQDAGSVGPPGLWVLQEKNAVIKERHPSEILVEVSSGVESVYFSAMETIGK